MECVVVSDPSTRRVNKLISVPLDVPRKPHVNLDQEVVIHSPEIQLLLFAQVKLGDQYF